MVDICEKSLCTGCHSCVNACGKKAISMQPDSFGFLYPHIDTMLCVDCGLCTKVCPVNHPPKAVYPATAYAVQSKDRADLMSSTSGGAASVFSQYVISQGGVVYGCSGLDITHICHTRIDAILDLNQLKGSKYVQSEISFVFQQVKEDLKAGKKVLFIGTPCQVAGLKNFLHVDYEILITVDLVCHGVPSQQLLLNNVEDGSYLQQKCRVFFRKKGKKETDLKYGVYVKGADSLIYSKNYPKDKYIMGFMQGLFHRNSCYSCHWADSNRCSDITVGDFWGLGKVKNIKIDKGLGVSEVLLNTKKGISFFEECKPLFYYEQRQVQEAVTGNAQLQYPSKRHPLYYQFQQLYVKEGFTKSCQKCLRRDYRHYYIASLKQSLFKLLIKVPYARSTYRKLKNIFRHE